MFIRTIFEILILSANINVEEKPVKFEVDLGSGFTFLPRKEFRELNLNKVITTTNVIFRSCTQNTFVPDGKVRVNIEFNGVSTSDDVYIVPDICAALAGRSWIRRLNINLTELDNLIFSSRMHPKLQCIFEITG